MGGHGVRQFERRCTLFGVDITAQVTILDNGVHVLLTGGERSHVGAVALAQNGELLACPSFSGHKERVVSERWALALSRKTRSCATVACGIHYDNATADQISEILHTCDGLLRETLAAMAERSNRDEGNYTNHQ